MNTRRDFVRKMIGGGIVLSHLHADADAVQPPAGKPDGYIHPGPYTIDNPYADVQWEKAHYVPSATHVHVESQEKLDKYYHRFGLRHIPISNYYPSAPTYPIQSIRYNQYAVEQRFEGVYNADTSKKGEARWADGKLLQGPFHWNDIIMKGSNAWVNELPAELQAKLPIQLGDFIFKNVPSDVIVSPNAEHHSFTDAPLHACAPGSMYSSGNFDVHDVFKTQEHGYAIGTGLPWSVVFKKMLDKLLFPDAGGITINHPVWSRLTTDQVFSMLDFDPRVLGIEVYNDTCASAFGDPPLGWSVKLWDEVLRTGRRCLGFFVPDHTIGRGKNILLVPSFTEYECLKAYRKGAFFGVINGSGLQFTRISLENNELSVALNDRAAIRIVTDKGEAQKASGKEVVYRIPMETGGVPAISYVRVEAVDEGSEQIFSQPIRFIK
jgi:hypothetical protein